MTLSRFLTRTIDFFYVKPIARVVPLQTFRYGVCGGLNMLFDWVLYYILFHFVVAGHWLDLGFAVMSPHIQALFIKFPIIFFTGFWLNRHVAFVSSHLRGGVQLARYLIQVAGSLVLSYLLMKLFVEAMHIYPTIANPLMTVITVLYSYFTARFFTFRSSGDAIGERQGKE